MHMDSSQDLRKFILDNLFDYLNPKRSDKQFATAILCFRAVCLGEEIRNDEKVTFKHGELHVVYNTTTHKMHLEFVHKGQVPVLVAAIIKIDQTDQTKLAILHQVTRWIDHPDEAANHVFNHRKNIAKHKDICLELLKLTGVKC